MIKLIYQIYLHTFCLKCCILSIRVIFKTVHYCQGEQLVITDNYCVTAISVLALVALRGSTVIALFYISVFSIVFILFD